MQAIFSKKTEGEPFWPTLLFDVPCCFPYNTGYIILYQ